MFNRQQVRGSISGNGTMSDHWDTIKHPHKDLITKEMLHGGTYIGEYPSMVKGAVNQIRKDFNGR